VVEHGKDVLDGGSFYAIHDFVVLVETHYLRAINSDTRAYYDEVGFWDIYHACQVLDFENLSTLSAVKILGREAGRLLDLEWHEIRRKMDYYFARFTLKDEVRAHQEVLLRSLLQSNVQLTQSELKLGEDLVEPTISNWFKYYYSFIGGQNNLSELKTAEFLVKDSFVQQLNEKDLKRLKNLLDLQEHLRLTPEELTEYGSTVFAATGYEGEFLAMSNGSINLLQSDEAKRARTEDEQTLERIAQELEDMNKPAPKRRSLRSQEKKPLPDLKPISSALEPESVTGKQVNQKELQYSQEVARLPEVDAHVLPQLVKQQRETVQEQPQTADDVVATEVTDIFDTQSPTPVEPTVPTDQENVIEEESAESAQPHDLVAAPPNLPVAKDDIPHELMVQDQVEEAQVMKDIADMQTNDDQLPINDDSAEADEIANEAVPPHVPVKQEEGEIDTPEPDVAEPPSEPQAQSAGANPLEQKVQALYIGHPGENAYIYERAERTKALSRAQATEALVNALHMKDAKGVVGSFIGLAHQGILEKDLVHDVRMVGFMHTHFQQLPKFDKIPVSMGDLIALLRLVLEDYLGLSEHEAARYGAHIGNAYSEVGNDEYSSIAHFDVDEGAFLWDLE
jgi:hypothetical protein